MTTTPTTPDATRLAERYLAAWNETDASRRREALATVFTGDARYVDPMMQSEGLDGLDAMIGAAQQKFPGFRFTLHGTPDGHNDLLRFSWSLAAGGQAPVAFGTDVATLAADGRMRQVLGFLDPA